MRVSSCLAVMVVLGRLVPASESSGNIIKSVSDFFFLHLSRFFNRQCPLASAWCTRVSNEVNGHVWKCIIVLVHLSHFHSTGHKSNPAELLGAAPYKSIASLYIINQRCMEISEEREGDRQHPHPDDKQHRSTVTTYLAALHSGHNLITSSTVSLV